MTAMDKQKRREAAYGRRVGGFAGPGREKTKTEPDVLAVHLVRAARRGRGVDLDALELDAANYDAFARHRRNIYEHGDPEEQLRIGAEYHTGERYPRNCTEAARWYLRAAEQGLAEAQYLIGKMYLDARDLGRDTPKARKWLGLAAAQGDQRAQRLYARIAATRHVDSARGRTFP